MNSGDGSKYLTPCRSFGLRRINRKTPAPSGVGKSINSPFTSPLTAGARTVPCIEKKRTSSLNSLWSTPLVSKTCLKMGLSKPSRKQKTKDRPSLGTYLESPGELSEFSGRGATPRVSREKCVGGPKSILKCQNDWDTPGTLSKKCLVVGATPESRHVACEKEGEFESPSKTPKTPLDKCSDIVTTPKPNFVKHSGQRATSNASLANSQMSTSDNINQENSANGFPGWNIESEESISLNSRLSIFRRFLENQVMKSTNVMISSPSNEESRCHSSISSDSELSMDDQNEMSSSESVNGRPSVEDGCVSMDKNTGNVGRESESLQWDASNESQTANNEEELRASHVSKSFDSDEEETDDKWDLASLSRTKCGTYTVKQNGTGKLSLKRQSFPKVSNRRMTTQKDLQICDRSTTVTQSFTEPESSDCRVATKQGETLGCRSSTEEFEKIKIDIQKWLEGGQRVILEIIEEVRLQKDREMSVMEVLEEQGVDPDLVGYDAQREEFISFDKFITKNNIS